MGRSKKSGRRRRKKAHNLFGVAPPEPVDLPNDNTKSLEDAVLEASEEFSVETTIPDAHDNGLLQADYSGNPAQETAPIADTTNHGVEPGQTPVFDDYDSLPGDESDFDFEPTLRTKALEPLQSSFLGMGSTEDASDSHRNRLSDGEEFSMDPESEDVKPITNPRQTDFENYVAPAPRPIPMPLTPENTPEIIPMPETEDTDQSRFLSKTPTLAGGTFKDLAAEAGYPSRDDALSIGIPEHIPGEGDADYDPNATTVDEKMEILTDNDGAIVGVQEATPATKEVAKETESPEVMGNPLEDYIPTPTPPFNPQVDPNTPFDGEPTAPSEKAIDAIGSDKVLIADAVKATENARAEEARAKEEQHKSLHDKIRNTEYYRRGTGLVLPFPRVKSDLITVPGEARRPTIRATENYAQRYQSETWVMTEELIELLNQGTNEEYMEDIIPKPDYDNLLAGLTFDEMKDIWRTQMAEHRAQRKLDEEKKTEDLAATKKEMAYVPVFLAAHQEIASQVAHQTSIIKKSKEAISPLDWSADARPDEESPSNKELAIAYIQNNPLDVLTHHKQYPTQEDLGYLTEEEKQEFLTKKDLKYLTEDKLMNLDNLLFEKYAKVLRDPDSTDAEFDSAHQTLKDNYVDVPEFRRAELASLIQDRCEKAHEDKGASDEWLAHVGAMLAFHYDYLPKDQVVGPSGATYSFPNPLDVPQPASEVSDPSSEEAMVDKAVAKVRSKKKGLWKTLVAATVSVAAAVGGIYALSTTDCSQKQIADHPAISSVYNRDAGVKASRKDASLLTSLGKSKIPSTLESRVDSTVPATDTGALAMGKQKDAALKTTPLVDPNAGAIAMGDHKDAAEGYSMPRDGSIDDIVGHDAGSNAQPGSSGVTEPMGPQTPVRPKAPVYNDCQMKVQMHFDSVKYKGAERIKVLETYRQFLKDLSEVKGADGKPLHKEVFVYGFAGAFSLKGYGNNPKYNLGLSERRAKKAQDDLKKYAAQFGMEATFINGESGRGEIELSNISAEGGKAKNDHYIKLWRTDRKSALQYAEGNIDENDREISSDKRSTQINMDDNRFVLITTERIDPNTTNDQLAEKLIDMKYLTATGRGCKAQPVPTKTTPKYPSPTPIKITPDQDTQSTPDQAPEQQTSGTKLETTPEQPTTPEPFDKPYDRLECIAPQQSRPTREKTVIISKGVGNSPVKASAEKKNAFPGKSVGANVYYDFDRERAESVSDEISRFITPFFGDGDMVDVYDSVEISEMSPEDEVAYEIQKMTDVYEGIEISKMSPEEAAQFNLHQSLESKYGPIHKKETVKGLDFYDRHDDDDTVESCLEDLGIKKREPTMFGPADTVEDAINMLGLNYVDGKPLTKAEKVQARIDELNREYQASTKEPYQAAGSIDEAVIKYVA